MLSRAVRPCIVPCECLCRNADTRIFRNAEKKIENLDPVQLPG